MSAPPVLQKTTVDRPIGTDNPTAASPQPHHRPSHLPGLDGVRGLAILMVIADHNFGVPGGAFGVDLFFTLSGFLITRLLLADRLAPAGYYRRFYLRRAFRIAPVYYVTLGIVLAFAASLRPYWWAFVFYLANFPVLPNAFFSPLLGHTWSLATEEQFYLIWPAAVRHVKPMNLVRVCVACVGLSIIARLAIPHVIHNPTYAQYWFAYAPFSRTDGLFVGASVAVLAEQAPSWLDRFAIRIGLGAAALVAIVAGLGSLSFSKMSSLMAAVGLPAAALMFGAIVWIGATSTGQVGRMLAAKWLRRVGKVSYALYLAHFPVVAVFSASVHGGRGIQFAAHALAAITAYLVAELSWRVLERPIAQLKDRLT